MTRRATIESPVGVEAAVRWRQAALVVLFLALLAETIMEGAFPPALPAIASRYHSSVTALAWLITGYGLVSAIAVPALGSISDVRSRRATILGVLALFTVGAACCASIHTTAGLIAGRTMEGILGAASPLILAFAADLVPRRRPSRAFAVMAGLSGFGLYVGFLAGALILGHGRIETLFVVLTAAGVILFGAFAAVPEPSRASTGGRSAKVDWLGFALLGGALLALQFVLGQGTNWHWSTGAVLGLVMAFALIARAFVGWQARARTPMIPRSLVAAGDIRLTWGILVLTGISLVGMFILIPELFEGPGGPTGAFGLSPKAAGVALVIAAAPLPIVGIVARGLANRLGTFQTIMVWMVITGAGYVGLTVARGTVAPVVVWMTLVLAGTWGTIAAGMIAVAAQSGSAIGVGMCLNGTMLSIGSSAGAQILAAIVNHEGSSGGLPLHAAYTAAFGAEAIVALVAGLVAAAVIAARGSLFSRRPQRGKN